MMEKGSFHTSRSSSHSANVSQGTDKNPGSTTLTRTLDEKVKGIAIPNQIPRGVDFADIPEAALKSSTLETLISQNEDLMARLSVNLRKTNELENRISQFEQENNAIKSRFDTLKEQYLVIQEKDRSSVSRALQMHEENMHQRSQLEKLEKLYTDLYIQAQAFQRRMSLLERYRARIKKASRSVQAHAKIARRLEHELVDYKTSQSAIYNESISRFENELNQAMSTVETLKAKADERDRVHEENTKLENQLIHDRRQFETKQTEQQARIDFLERENASLRSQLKELLIERESTTQDLSRLQSEIPNLQTERTRLTEQVESLQALWNFKQRELEQAEEKNRSLQKLNQSISVTLNSQRKELHSLEVEIEKEQMTAKETIKTLLSEIQMLRVQLVETGNAKL